MAEPGEDPQGVSLGVGNIGDDPESGKGKRSWLGGNGTVNVKEGTVISDWYNHSKVCFVALEHAGRAASRPTVLATLTMRQDVTGGNRYFVEFVPLNNLREYHLQLLLSHASAANRRSHPLDAAENTQSSHLLPKLPGLARAVQFPEMHLPRFNGDKVTRAETEAFAQLLLTSGIAGSSPVLSDGGGAGVGSMVIPLQRNNGDKQEAMEIRSARTRGSGGDIDAASKRRTMGDAETASVRARPGHRRRGSNESIRSTTSAVSSASRASRQSRASRRRAASPNGDREMAGKMGSRRRTAPPGSLTDSVLAAEGIKPLPQTPTLTISKNKSPLRAPTPGTQPKTTGSFPVLMSAPPTRRPANLRGDPRITPERFLMGLTEDEAKKELKPFSFNVWYHARHRFVASNAKERDEYSRYCQEILPETADTSSAAYLLGGWLLKFFWILLALPIHYDPVEASRRRAERRAKLTGKPQGESLTDFLTFTLSGLYPLYRMVIALCIGLHFAVPSLWRFVFGPRLPGGSFLLAESWLATVVELLAVLAMVQVYKKDSYLERLYTTLFTARSGSMHWRLKRGYALFALVLFPACFLVQLDRHWDLVQDMRSRDVGGATGDNLSLLASAMYWLLPVTTVYAVMLPLTLLSLFIFSVDNLTRQLRAFKNHVRWFANSGEQNLGTEFADLGFFVDVYSYFVERTRNLMRKWNWLVSSAFVLLVSPLLVLLVAFLLALAPPSLTTFLLVLLFWTGSLALTGVYVSTNDTVGDVVQGLDRIMVQTTDHEHWFVQRFKDFYRSQDVYLHLFGTRLNTSMFVRVVLAGLAVILVLFTSGITDAFI